MTGGRVTLDENPRLQSLLSLRPQSPPSLCQNKFAKAWEWEQTETMVRLVVSYFNWIWVHSRKENTATMRARLANYNGTLLLAFISDRRG
ncbi:hypothetical protein ACLFKQ_07590 [Myxosarcina sp. GI1(2024)]